MGGPLAAGEVTPSPLAQIASNLRAERRRAGVSLSELARAAGVSKSTLSQLEAGAGNPSVETLWAVASALGIPFARLVETRTTPVQVIRAADRASIPSTQADYAAALLAPGRSHERRDVFVIELEPGEPRRADPHPSGSVEHAVVAAGRVRVGPVSGPVEAGPGDYVSFPGDVAHSYEALEPGSWMVLVMQHPGS